MHNPLNVKLLVSLQSKPWLHQNAVCFHTNDSYMNMPQGYGTNTLPTLLYNNWAANTNPTFHSCLLGYVITSQIY